MTATQLTKSETALNGLKNEIAILKQNSNVSAIQLIEATKKLAKAEELLQTSQSSTQEIQRLLDEARIELANLKLSFEKYVKEAQLILNKEKAAHRRDNFIRDVIIGVLLYDKFTQR